MNSPSTNDDSGESAVRGAPGSAREFLGVAVPLVLSAGSLAIMNVIDRLLLTWYDIDALAAAMPAGMVHWTIVSIPIGIVLYVNTFVAQYDGAEKPERVVASVWQGFYIALVTGVALLALIPLAPWMFSLTGHTPKVVELETVYFTTLCWGSVTYTIANALSCFYTGRRATHVVMWVNLASVAVNFVVDYVLIFGWGPFPEMGIEGAAWGTVLARTMACVAYFVLLKWFNDHEAHDFRGWPKFDLPLLKRLLRFGVPNGIHFFIDVFGFTVFVLLIGGIGSRELAATSLAFNLNTLAFIPLFGFGMAVSTLVGNRVGEGKPEIAEATTWNAFRLASCWMGFFAIVYLVAPDLVLDVYSRYSKSGDFTEIRGNVIVLLRFVSAYCFFDGMAVVFSSAVRGAGDTRFPMLMSFIGCWIIMVLPTAIMNHYGGSLLGSWSACTAYIVLIGFAMLLRFRGGKWKTMKVIESGIVENADGAESEPATV